MKDRFRLSLGALWLLTSLSTLILPIFIPSYANPQSFIQNVIGTSTVTMFILSFPSSLFGIPILFFAQNALGVDPNTISGMYLNLFLLFVLGLVQWFWIVPRIWRGEPAIQSLNLPRTPEMQLSEAKPVAGFSFFDTNERTPIERVFEDEDR
jgi:hypothetical protein